MVALDDSFVSLSHLEQVCTKCHTISLTKGHWLYACNSALSLLPRLLLSVFCIFFIDVYAYCLSLILKTKNTILTWPPSATTPFLFCPYSKTAHKSYLNSPSAILPLLFSSGTYTSQTFIPSALLDLPLST